MKRRLVLITDCYGRELIKKEEEVEDYLMISEGIEVN